MGPLAIRSTCWVPSPSASPLARPFRRRQSSLPPLLRHRDRKHFKEPTDLSLLVRLANAVGGRCLAESTGFTCRCPNYRTDEAYFLPLLTSRCRGAPLPWARAQMERCRGCPAARRTSRTGARRWARVRRLHRCGIGQVLADVAPRDWITETLDICQAVSTPEHRG